MYAHPNQIILLGSIYFRRNNFPRKQHFKTRNKKLQTCHISLLYSLIKVTTTIFFSPSYYRLERKLRVKKIDAQKDTSFEGHEIVARRKKKLQTSFHNCHVTSIQITSVKKVFLPKTRSGTSRHHRHYYYSGERGKMSVCCREFFSSSQFHSSSSSSSGTRGKKLTKITME